MKTNGESVPPTKTPAKLKKLYNLFIHTDFNQAGVRRTNFDKQNACRRTDSHRFGAMHPPHLVQRTSHN